MLSWVPNLIRTGERGPWKGLLGSQGAAVRGHCCAAEPCGVRSIAGAGDVLAPRAWGWEADTFPLVPLGCLAAHCEQGCDLGAGRISKA